MASRNDIVSNWWAKKWLEALETCDYENRLPRGRSYFRRRMVDDLELHPRSLKVEARVYGSAYWPYTVSIKFSKIEPALAQKLVDRIADEPMLLAELLDHRLPPEVATIASDLGIELFPRDINELKPQCSCPDWAQVCKHVAAVFYAVAEQIDIDPFLIFRLHGLDLVEKLKKYDIDVSKSVVAKPLTFKTLFDSEFLKKPDPAALGEQEAVTALRTLPYGNLPNLYDIFSGMVSQYIDPTTKRDCKPEFLRFLKRTSSALKQKLAQAVARQDFTESREMTPSAAMAELIKSINAFRNQYFPETGTSRQAQRLPDPKGARVSLLFDFCRGMEYEVRLTYTRPESGETKEYVVDQGAFFNALLEAPRPVIQTLSAEFECWAEITKTAAHLFVKSCVAPVVLVPSSGYNPLPRVWWTPAVRNGAVAALFNSLVAAAAPWLEKTMVCHELAESQKTQRQRAFLAMTMALNGLMWSCAQYLIEFSKKNPDLVWLSSQFLTDEMDGNQVDHSDLIDGLMVALRSFMLAGAYPWQPVLTARLYQDDVKLNFGILPHEVSVADIEAAETDQSADSLDENAPKRPVMLARLLKDKRYEADRFAALTVLKTLSSVCPDLETLYQTRGKPLSLSASALKTFLFDAAPTLALLGVSVMLPASLKKLLRPRLVAHAGLNNRGKAFFGRDDLTSFQWKVALDDRELTEEEFKKLTQDAGGIVRIGDKFVYIDPAELERMAHTLEKQPQPSYLQKMRAVLTGQLDGVEIAASEALEEKLRTLTHYQSIPVPAEIHATLRPYQERGFSWLMKNLRLGLGALIADDMGLGKTLQVIAAITQLKLDGELAKSKVLAVVPATLITNWVREIAKFSPTLTTGIYHGSDRVLAEKAADLPDVTLTTYGLLRRDFERLSKLPWRLLVLDEAQAVKNAGAAQSDAARALKAKQTIAMTGTPVENRLLEYWSILDIVQPKLLGTAKDFEKTFADPIEDNHDASAAEAFRKLTAPFMLRRLKSDKSIISDLPDKISVDQFTALTAEQAALYEKALSDHMARLEQLEALRGQEGVEDINIRRKGEVLKLIMSLKQICNSPSQYLKTASVKPDSGKAASLFEILAMNRDAGRKTLIFTQFREMGELLQQWIGKATGIVPEFLHGGVSVKRRQEMVDSFQNDRTVPVLLISLKAGGTGLNLTAASSVIHYDLWWNPAVENQATDRAYRIGQQRDVLVYRFVTAGTFEERINEMLEQKRELSNLTVATGETWIGDLSTEELRALFALDKKAAQG